MKSRVLQFLCAIHIIYVELPQWNFFLSREGRRVETEINLLNLLYVNSTRTGARSRLESGFILPLSSAALALTIDPGTGASPRPLLQFQEIKTICITTLSYYLPFSRYGPFAGVGSKHWWVKFLTPLQERRPRPVPVSGHCVRCCCGLAGHKTSAGSFENVLHEAVKSIEFIKF